MRAQTGGRLGGGKVCECRSGLTWIEVLDVGLLSLSLQLLPSDGICLLHLELHLTEEKRDEEGKGRRWGVNKGDNNV